MSEIFMNGTIIVLGLFFFGMLFYGFYIVLKPTTKKSAKNMRKTKNSNATPAR